MRLLERFPERLLAHRVATARLAGRELEVLQIRHQVVLPAGRACCHREVGVLLVAAASLDLVLRSEPQAWHGAVTWKTDNGPANPPHEAVHDGAKQRSPLDLGGRAEREPAQDLRLRHIAADRAPEGIRQLRKGPRLTE